ncbi:Mu-like prophage major head subunit gpT family protein [Pseudomonas sp. GD04158]|uniref:Mu-like prophage major head subunit gpT family protein n=1 Tax=Pseudomonas sp. GD04158 TaxID=2975439 RepID=UPI0024476C8E|nr:Mu-like prophage major head subunit gpT family protein [Pseudomonas sp. GD04158]MDH0095862.1 Mu-like prophage major head subunit gpT family protein [Pseudomonas sp. GD04158]
MIINKQNLAILHTGFKASFQNAFDGAPIDYNQLVMEVNSGTAIEQYGWLGATTRFREWIGDRVIQNLALHDYSIKNKSFENTVGVPREAIEDDQYGTYNPLMAQLGQDAKEHPAELVYALLKNGFTGKCYDGQFFFDTDHPVLGANGQETSVSNFQGGSGTPWFLLDVTRVMRPIILQKRKNYQFVAKTDEKDENVFSRKEFIWGVDARLNVGYGLWQLAYASRETLNAANFNAAYAAMQSMKGDNGRPLGIRPKLLVVPPSLRATAMEVVKAERNAAGATNINRDVVDVLTTPWLA